MSASGGRCSYLSARGTVIGLAREARAAGTSEASVESAKKRARTEASVRGSLEVTRVDAIRRGERPLVAGGPRGDAVGQTLLLGEPTDPQAAFGIMPPDFNFPSVA